MSNATISPLMKTCPPQALEQTRPAQALEWFIIVETGSLAGRRYPLTSTAGSLTLGRESDCTIRFDPHQERMVGRHHARIEVRADGVYLVDTNSANGTFKDGEAVGEVRLKHGDRFQLGGAVDDLQGPWMSINMPVAVHLLPMSNDPTTMIIRPAAPSPASAPVHVPAPQVAVHRPPAVVPASELTANVFLPPAAPAAASAPQVAPLPYAPLPSAPARPPTAAALPAAVIDPLHRQRRTYLLQQIAAVVMLLVLACGIGVALGLRDSADADTESAPSKNP